MDQMSKNRLAILTVDTEALPKRAVSGHVDKLIWGHHPQGTAGVKEICAIGDEFGLKHVFFIDMCGAYAYEREMENVVRFLDASCQDVQLHAHPEYLPEEFWTERNLKPSPCYMNKYRDVGRARLIVSHFGTKIAAITGKPIHAFRAGSFRWNAGTIRALEAEGIKLSFNNSPSAVRAGQCLYSAPTNKPFLWSNGVLEIPMTERLIFPGIGHDEWWARLKYPESKFFRFKPWWGWLTFNLFSGNPDFAVFLMHSWSLLCWDENGYGQYQNDERLEGYRRLLKKISLDYDVITTSELLVLYSEGKIALGPQIDLNLADLSLQSKSKGNGKP
jgi:hypothetical protein